MNIPTPFDSESPSAHEYNLDVKFTSFIGG